MMVIYWGRDFFLIRLNNGPRAMSRFPGTGAGLCVEKRQLELSMRSPSLLFLALREASLCQAILCAAILSTTIISSEALAADSSAPKWEGHWTRIGDAPGTSASLDTRLQPPDELELTLDAQKGEHVGMIEDARAKITGSSAVFSTSENGKSCPLTLRLEGDEIVVETTAGCAYDAGAGVALAGRYRRE